MTISPQSMGPFWSAVSPLDTATAPQQSSELANTQLSEQEKIGKLCREFEAVLLRQILQAAQKTVITSELTPEAAGSEMYRDLITSQLAEAISHSGSFGFAKDLERELSQQLISRTDSREKIEQ